MSDIGLKRILADRIIAAAQKVDYMRKREPYYLNEYAEAATVICDGLARIDELELIWQEVYNEEPNGSDIVANSSGGTV